MEIWGETYHLRSCISGVLGSSISNSCIICRIELDKPFLLHLGSSSQSDGSHVTNLLYTSSSGLKVHEFSNMSRFHSESHSGSLSYMERSTALSLHSPYRYTYAFSFAKAHNKTHLGLLFPFLRSFRLCCLFSITPYHDYAQETPHHGGPQEDQNDGDANRPHAGREVGMEWMALIDERLPQANVLLAGQ